jgi:hypothetical protein
VPGEGDAGDDTGCGGVGVTGGDVQMRMDRACWRCRGSEA